MNLLTIFIGMIVLAPAIVFRKQLQKNSIRPTMGLCHILEQLGKKSRGSKMNIFSKILTTIWNAFYCTEILQSAHNLATELENEYVLYERRTRLNKKGGQ